MSTEGDMGKMKIGGEVEGERESTYWRQVVPPKQEFNVAEEEEGQGGTQIAPPPKLKRKRNLPGRPGNNNLEHGIIFSRKNDSSMQKRKKNLSFDFVPFCRSKLRSDRIITEATDGKEQFHM